MMQKTSFLCPTAYRKVQSSRTRELAQRSRYLTKMRLEHRLWRQIVIIQISDSSQQNVYLDRSLYTSKFIFFIPKMEITMFIIEFL
jgi:hypothetical protein